MYVILAASMFPLIAVLPGLYSIVNSLRLYNTWGALIFSYLIFTLPFTVWTLTAFVRDIPTELYEYPFGQVMAASVVVTIPLIVLVLVFQRKIVEGLIVGAVKG